MSLIVTVYVNDGIVMGSDSRTTLRNTQSLGPVIKEQFFPFSDASYKTFECCNNCGISACGDASLNNKPIAEYIEFFGNNIINKTTSIIDMPQMLIEYFDKINKDIISIFHVCGYENIDGKIKKHVYRIVTGKNKSIEEVIKDGACGASWDGEVCTLSKLLKKQILNPNIINVENLSLNNKGNAIPTLIPKAFVIDSNNAELYNDANIAFDLMSLQDAIDFVRYAINTTIDTMRFTNVNKTVGGPIDILVIKPQKTQWISHKKLH